MPEGRFRVEFQGSADSVAARTYSLVDLATGTPVFEGGTDFSGERTGPIAFGIQPIVTTLDGVRSKE